MIIFFDGYCVLCSAFARWLKKHLGPDITLKALQSAEGLGWLKENGYSPDKVDEVLVVVQKTVITGSEAILFILTKAGGLWPQVAYILKLMPRSLIKWSYRVIANHRYRWFGRKKSCTIL